MFVRKWSIHDPYWERRGIIETNPDSFFRPPEPSRRLTIELDVSPFELDALRDFLENRGAHPPPEPEPEPPRGPPALRCGIIDAEFIDDD